MRVSPRTALLLIYLFLMLFIYNSIVYNEYTMPYVAMITALLVFGLLLILGWHYIIPFIIRPYFWGTAKVDDEKYVIVHRRGSSELVGYVFMKLIPRQPISEMDKDKKEAVLKAMEGVLSGANFEAGLLLINIRDRYAESIIEKLEAKRSLLLAISRGSQTSRSRLDQLDAEIKMLQRTPLFEGLYIVFIRDYGTNEIELKRKLESDARALQGQLQGIIAVGEILKGEELRSILDLLLFGSLVQISAL